MSAENTKINFAHITSRFERLLEMQHLYLTNRKVDKIKRISDLIEKLTLLVKAYFFQNPKRMLADQESSIWKHIRHLYEVNKALATTYQDISHQCFQNIKRDQKEKWAYGKSGKSFVHMQSKDGVLYSKTV